MLPLQVAERASAEIQRMGGSGSASSKRMSAAEYRAARRSGKIGPSAVRAACL